MNELKVDKSLLINGFDTYKLSLGNLRKSKKEIPGGVKIRTPNDDQFSFLHHKEFSFHNHLYSDSWNENGIYIITNEGKVKKVLINNQTELIFGLIDVWEIPKQSFNTSSNFNASISFSSPELALITDGLGFLYIIETFNRNEIGDWKTVYSGEILGEVREFKVSCSQLQDLKQTKEKKLHCILLSIEHSIAGTTSSSKTAGFETLLRWVVFSEDGEGKWDKEIVNELRGYGSIDYLALELGCQALYVISDKEVYSPSLKEEEQMKDLQKSSSQVEPDYYWQQTEDFVRLWFNLEAGVDKNDLKVETKIDFINISCKESLLLYGNLFDSIDTALTTWNIENSKLEVTMQKSAIGSVWKCMINDGDKVGKEIINEEFVSGIHKKLAHLCSDNQEQGDVAMLNSGELEECDAFGENRFLRRFQIRSGKVTHKVLLGSDQWLFHLNTCGSELPAFCMRRDVDGIVWQPKQPILTDQDSVHLECVHMHTIPAFGYIAASKLDKKFLIAPANFEYAAVVNSVGHVVIYRKRDLTGTSVLRNRKAGGFTNNVYIQNLVNLESNSEIVGAVASNNYIFILTLVDIIMISFNEE